jgi:hypothetical protein
MNLTQQTISELPIQERRQFGTQVNYFLSKEYFASKQRKKVQIARTRAELGVEDDGNS